MEKPTISLCMIVKNESELLPLCLESVQGVVDEIIIVDTGSIDDTKEIATQYGARVVDFTWTHDFAAARNFANEQATCDWILQLDADEQLAEATKDQLLEAVTHAMSYALQVRIKNYNDKTKNYLLHQYPRLYRNVPEIRYANRIHEQLLYDGQPIETHDCNVQIIHLGYVEEIVKKKNKGARNVRLLQEELRQNPKNAFMHYNLGNELMKTKEFKKAINHYEIAHKESTNFSVKSSSVLQIVKAYVQQKKLKEALYLLKEARTVYPDYTDLSLIQGEIYEELGREEEAKALYKHCLTLGEAPKRYVTIAGVGLYYPLNKLALLAIKQRQMETALGYLTEFTEIDPYSFAHAEKVINILLPMFGKEKVIEFIDETYPSESEKDRSFKSRLAHHFRLYAEFSRLFPETEDQFSEDEKDILHMYLHIGDVKGSECAQKFAQKNATRHFALVHYLLTKDEGTKEVLQRDKTCAFIIAGLEGTQNAQKKSQIKKEIYVKTLQELMKLAQYEHVETLIPFALFFSPHAFADIGDLFTTYQQNDLAIEYYTKYLMKNKQDFDVYLKVARLLSHGRLFEEALLFAEEAHKLNPNHFKPMELLLESCENLALQDAAKQYAKHFLHAYPDSLYLQEKAN